MGGNWFDETFGEDLTVYDEYSKPATGDFDLFPDNTRVLATVESVVGKTNKNGKAYPAMVLTVTSWPETCKGNYGRPKLHDNMKLTLPEAPNKYFGQPEEVVKKKQQAAGIWLRQVKALGLNPKTLGGQDAEAVGAFFANAVGAPVIVRVMHEDASGDYRAKNTVAGYEEATPAALKKYGLKAVIPEPVAF